MISPRSEQAIQVLLVEDEQPFVSEVTQSMGSLNRSNELELEIALETVGSLTEAIEHLRSFFVDVILLDLSLPDAQGVGSVQELAQQFPNIPIVVLTNVSGWGSMIRSAEAGARDFLLKNELETKALFRAVYHAYERKQVEDRLRQLQEIHRTLVEHLPVGGFRKDLFGRYLYVNRVFCEMVGYEAADIVEHSDHDLFSGHAAQVLACQDRELISTQQATEQETELKTAAGKTFYTEIVKIPVFDAEEEVVGIQGILYDLTERKNAEDQRRISDRFEGMQALGREIVHHVKNRLAPVALDASILESQCENSDMIALCQKIAKATTKSGETLQHLLMFSEEETTAKMPVDLDLVFSEMSRFVQKNAPQGIDFSVCCSGNLPSISADFEPVKNLLEILCKNAWESMGESGQITVTVNESETNRLLAPGNLGSKTVVIRVQDTGSGISPDIRKRIFDPYFTTKDAERFLGMGLTNAMAMIRKLEGSLRVDPDVERGTCFEVIFPSVDSTVGSKLEASDGGTGQTILLVDDEAPIIDTGKVFLEGHGFQVITAQNGAEAIGKFTEHAKRVDLVLTDLMMPHMDGVALTKAIRSQSPFTPILVATGLESRENLERLDDVGIQGIVSKPFSPENLIRQIVEQLDKSSMRTSST